MSRTGSDDVSMAISYTQAKLAAVARVVKHAVEHQGELDLDEGEGAVQILHDVRQDLHERVYAPLVENGTTPPEPSAGLTLSEEEVWAIGVDLWRIAFAAMYPRDHEMEGVRNCPSAIVVLANRVCDHLFERAGIPLSDETNGKLNAATHSFGEKAAKMGADAVDATALEEVES